MHASRPRRVLVSVLRLPLHHHARTCPPAHQRTQTEEALVARSVLKQGTSSRAQQRERALSLGRYFGEYVQSRASESKSFATYIADPGPTRIRRTTRRTGSQTVSATTPTELIPRSKSNSNRQTESGRTSEFVLKLKRVRRMKRAVERGRRPPCQRPAARKIRHPLFLLGLKGCPTLISHRLPQRED